MIVQGLLEKDLGRFWLECGDVMVLKDRGKVDIYRTSVAMETPLCEWLTILFAVNHSVMVLEPFRTLLFLMRVICEDQLDSSCQLSNVVRRDGLGGEARTSSCILLRCW